MPIVKTWLNDSDYKKFIEKLDGESIYAFLKHAVKEKMNNGSLSIITQKRVSDCDVERNNETCKRRMLRVSANS